MGKTKAVNSKKQHTKQNRNFFTEFNEDPVFLQQLADCNPAIIFVIDLQSWKFIYINNRANELLGYTETDLVMQGVKAFSELVHPDDYEKQLHYLNSLSGLNDTETKELEIRLKIKDKGFCWFHISNRIFKRNEKGEAMQSIGIVQEVPGLVGAQLQTLFDNTPLGVYLVDADFRIRAVNPVALPVFGNIPDLIGQDFDKTIHILWGQEFADEIVRIFRHTLKTGEPYIDPERAERRRDLNVIEYYEWQINRIPLSDGSYGVVCYFRDISAAVFARLAIEESEEIYRSKLEYEVVLRTAELKESKELLQAIFDASPNSISVYNIIYDDQQKPVDFEILNFNAFSYKNTGVSSEVIGKRYSEVFPRVIVSGVLDKFKEVARTGKQADFEQWYDGEGMHHWLRFIVTKLESLLIVTTEDITAAKKADEKIKDLNIKLTHTNRELESRNSELNTFNSIAANDYNETLRNLYTSLEYIVTNDAGNLSNNGRANIRRAQSSIQKMKLLTEDIISYTKLHEIDTEVQVIDLDTIIENVLADFEKKLDMSNLKIECDSLPTITGYPFLISLVLHHLLDNAIKFRKENISLQVKISCREFIPGSATGHEEAHPDVHYHIVSLADNGIGFQQQEAKKIFDIFYRLNDKSFYKGSGIGLAVCKKIMDMHNGFIITESEPGNGSTFHCFFPIQGN